jgi:soluble lytic murein transglycosylase
MNGTRPKISLSTRKPICTASVEQPFIDSPPGCADNAIMEKLTRTLSLFPILLTLIGCSLSAQPDVIIVTSDAPPAQRTEIAATVAATRLPTSTPAPSATPTPNVDPSVLLQQADQQRLNGYYSDALQTYQRAASVPGDTQPEALFRSGQVAVLEGLFGLAIDPLTTLIITYPDHPRVPQAYFLRGDAYLGRSEWGQALTDFETYLSLQPGLLDSYVYERVGDAQLALGQRPAALQSYEQAVAANRSLVPLLVLRERLAQIYLNGGQLTEAIAEYDAILSVAQNPAYRASIQYMAGQALLNNGSPTDGLARMRIIFDNYPSTSTAYDAMRELDAANINLSDYDRGIVAFNYGDYPLAIDAFNSYTTQTPLANVPTDTYLFLGRAYRQIDNNNAANVAFRTVIDQYPQSPAFGDALLEQGRTLFLAGDWLAAVDRYSQIAENYAYLTDTAAEALWRVGYLYGTNGEATLSAQTFERLADAYPNTDQAQSGLFIGASSAYAAGNFSTAERMYARLAVTAEGEDRAAAYFWLGQIARQAGNEDTATRAFQSALDAAPDSYFAARSRDIVNGVAAFQPPAQTTFTFDTDTTRAEAETWLRQTFAIQQDRPLYPLSPQLAADPRLVRGSELWQLGQYTEAETEFFDIINEKRDSQDALASYQLAVYLRDMGAYYPSIFAAAHTIQIANVSTLDAPPYIARMRYPAYYADVIQQVGGPDADPLLMLSLIRHESLFNANATAAADEKGLTQVIPSTGQYIAQQLGWPDYQHTDLFRPYASITFGTYYLDEQLQRFGGNVTAALAGYNAGPGRAQDWLSLSGGNPDLFMTTITIDSTRLYIQLIYRNHSIYRALYGA